MFLVRHERAGAVDLVFTTHDPRQDGYKGEVKEGVTLDYDMGVHEWPHGAERPDVVTGCDLASPSRYKVFKYARQVDDAGFQTVGGKACAYPRWSDYTKLLGG